MSPTLKAGFFLVPEAPDLVREEDRAGRFRAGRFRAGRFRAGGEPGLRALDWGTDFLAEGFLAAADFTDFPPDDGSALAVLAVLVVLAVVLAVLGGAVVLAVLAV